MPSHLQSLTFLPQPLSLGCIFTSKGPIPAPPVSLRMPSGQAASLAAQCLPRVWGPAHTTLDRLWTSSGRGWREQGKGGAGPALMQSRGGGGLGGCPHGGWSAAASAPAPEASPGTIRAGSGSLLGLLRALGPGGFT